MTGKDAAHDGEYVRRPLDSGDLTRESWKVVLTVCWLTM
jgi:hypothetical protein